MAEIAARDFLIALSLLPFLTPNRVRLLLETFDPLSSTSSASSSFLSGLLSVTPDEAALVKNPLTAAVRPQVESLRTSVVTLADPAYPTLLREIVDPPLILHYRGNPALLAKPSVAVVGSRRASPYGVNAARHLAGELAARGVAIVSGLARGIDAAAHEAALDAGGATIAVIGTGIDLVYPRSNAALFRRIETQGVIVTELPPATPPYAGNFPMRNRVISGLTHGVVVVEATNRSGSLITARMAAEQGREVFAVPGTIFSAGSEGAHRLIQYGAKLVHDANDVVDELPGAFPAAAPTDLALPDGIEATVLAALRRDEAISVDALAAGLRCAPAGVAQALLELELAGWIRALPGARYVRAR